jgi:hypothetical protein
MATELSMLQGALLELSCLLSSVMGSGTDHMLVHNGLLMFKASFLKLRLALKTYLCGIAEKGVMFVQKLGRI